MVSTIQNIEVLFSTPWHNQTKMYWQYISENFSTFGAYYCDSFNNFFEVFLCLLEFDDPLVDRHCQQIVECGMQNHRSYIEVMMMMIIIIIRHLILCGTIDIDDYYCYRLNDFYVKCIRFDVIELVRIGLLPGVD